MLIWVHGSFRFKLSNSIGYKYTMQLFAKKHKSVLFYPQEPDYLIGYDLPSIAAQAKADAPKKLREKLQVMNPKTRPTCKKRRKRSPLLARCCRLQDD